MPLDSDELRLFYQLYPALLYFVNRRQGITSAPFTKPGHFGKLPIGERLKLRDALVGGMDLIDAFVAENPFKLSEDELEVVRSWNDLEAGEFYVYRCLKKYTVFLTTGEPVVAYGVLSLTDPLEDLVGHRLPHLCKAVLLPFKGRIVYDGMLAGYNVHFGGGVRRRLKASYNDAKERHGIITSLPPPAVDLDGMRDQPRKRGQASRPRGRTKGGKPTSSEAARLAHDEIVGIIDAYCHEFLDDEYGALCRKLAGVLARKRPSPLTRGKPESWASGIVRVIGWINFLNDPSQPHHMTMADIDERIGVSEATGSAKATAIRKLVKIRPFDPEWTLPGRMDDNPLAWMIEVNGLIADARRLPREIREAAFRKGLIPYVPGKRAGDPAEE
jgi:hypothetical protein